MEANPLRTTPSTSRATTTEQPTAAGSSQGEERATTECVTIIPTAIDISLLQRVDGQSNFREPNFQEIRRAAITQVAGYLKYLRPDTLELARDYHEFLQNYATNDIATFNDMEIEKFFVGLGTFADRAREVKASYDKALLYSETVGRHSTEILSQMARIQKVAEDEEKQIRKSARRRNMLLKFWGTEHSARLAKGAENGLKIATKTKKNMQEGIHNASHLITVRQMNEKTLTDCQVSFGRIITRIHRLQRDAKMLTSLNAEFQSRERLQPKLISFAESNSIDLRRFVVGLEHNQNLLSDSSLKTKSNVRDLNRYRLCLIAK